MYEEENEQVAKADELTQLMQQITLLEKIAKQKMSREAIARYGNLKLAHSELVIRALAMIAQAVQQGQLRKPISDEEFKALLLELQRGKKQFTFKK